MSLRGLQQSLSTNNGTVPEESSVMIAESSSSSSSSSQAITTQGMLTFIILGSLICIVLVCIVYLCLRKRRDGTTAFNDVKQHGQEELDNQVCPECHGNGVIVCLTCPILCGIMCWKGLLGGAGDRPDDTDIFYNNKDSSLDPAMAMDEKPSTVNVPTNVDPNRQQPQPPTTEQDDAIKNTAAHHLPDGPKHKVVTFKTMEDDNDIMMPNKDKSFSNSVEEEEEDIYDNDPRHAKGVTENEAQQQQQQQDDAYDPLMDHVPVPWDRVKRGSDMFVISDVPVMPLDDTVDQEKIPEPVVVEDEEEWEEVSEEEVVEEDVVNAQPSTMYDSDMPNSDIEVVQDFVDESRRPMETGAINVMEQLQPTQTDLGMEEELVDEDYEEVGPLVNLNPTLENTLLEEPFPDPVKEDNVQQEVVPTMKEERVDDERLAEGALVETVPEDDKITEDVTDTDKSQGIVETANPMVQDQVIQKALESSATTSPQNQSEQVILESTHRDDNNEQQTDQGVDEVPPLATEPSPLVSNDNIVPLEDQPEVTDTEHEEIEVVDDHYLEEEILEEEYDEHEVHEVPSHNHDDYIMEEIVDDDSYDEEVMEDDDHHVQIVENEVGGNVTEEAN